MRWLTTNLCLLHVVKSARSPPALYSPHRELTLLVSRRLMNFSYAVYGTTDKW